MTQGTPDSTGSTTQISLRYFCFVLLAGAGLFALAIAFLAGPLNTYYADQAALNVQQKRLDKLNELIEQQNELIANANVPSVLERVAITNLNYQPASEIPDAKRPPLPRAWPSLENALKKLETPDSRLPKPLEKWAAIFSDRPQTLLILTILGSALLLTSVTFFYRQG